jgi:hypothetical protein
MPLGPFASITVADLQRRYEITREVGIQRLLGIASFRQT